jgi:hypothetical protein
MPRAGAKKIDRLALLDELAKRPHTPRELGKALNCQADSVRRRLRQLASGRFVTESPVREGHWELGPRAGHILVGAVGSSRINAGVFDTYVRTLSAVATRRSALPSWRMPEGEDQELEAVIDRTADMMILALEKARRVTAIEIAAIAFALPYGIDPGDGTLLTHHPGANPREMLAAALADKGIGVDLGSVEWAWASDVAYEGVFEYHFGGAPQQGASPLLLVKVSRNVRSGLILSGVPLSGAAGDVADLGEITTWYHEGEEAERRGEPTLIPLREAVSLERLYRQILGEPLVLTEAEEMTDAEWFERRFRPVLAQRGERGAEARRAMAQAGEMIGRCLDGPIAVAGPGAVVLTGFLARDDAQLRDGLLRACGHHRTDAGTAIELSSGIEAELRGGVVDAEDLTQQIEACLGSRMEPQALPHQYRVAAGAAKLVIEQRLRPALRVSAIARDEIERAVQRGDRR